MKAHLTPVKVMTEKQRESVMDKSIEELKKNPTSRSEGLKKEMDTTNLPEV